VSRVLCIQRIVFLLIPFAFAGCSTADFKQPVSAFSDATKVAAASFDDYANSIDQIALEQNISDVVAGNAKLKIPDCKRQSKQCRLFMTINNGTKPIKAALLPNIRKIMVGLVTYASDLDAIATSDTAGEIKNASDAAQANLVSLAKGIDSLNTQLGKKTTVETEVSAFGAPIGDILTLTLTKYAEEVKLEALREATARMDSVFPDITKAFVQVALSDNDIKTTRLFDKFVKARADYDDSPTNETLEALQTAADAYNVALTAKPGEVFTKLSDAHAALTMALRAPKIDFATVFALIQQVSGAATKLAADAKALDKALHPQPTT
jgi:hypothetical protein